MSNINAIKAKIEKQSNVIKWVLGTGIIVVVGIVGAFVIKSMIMLGIIIVGALVLVNGAPVLSMKFKNAKLKAIKAEAEANPIETLQNLWNEKKKGLAERLEKIEKFHAKIERFSERRGAFAIDYPEDAPRFNIIEQKMVAIHKARQNKWVATNDLLAKEWKEIQRASAIWEMSLAANELKESAGQSESDFMEKIKTETAYDSISNRLAESVAQLDTLMLTEVNLDIKAVTEEDFRIANDPSRSFDYVDAEVRQVVPVGGAA